MNLTPEQLEAIAKAGWDECLRHSSIVTRDWDDAGEHVKTIWRAAVTAILSAYESAQEYYAASDAVKFLAVQLAERAIEDVLSGSSARPGGWQPIESAPKDGTDILAVREEDGKRGRARFVVDTDDTEDGGAWWFEDTWSAEQRLICWQPLPSPPGSPDAKEQVFHIERVHNGKVDDVEVQHTAIDCFVRELPSGGAMLYAFADGWQRVDGNAAHWNWTPRQCPQCGSHNVIFHGVGSEYSCGDCSWAFASSPDAKGTT